LVQILTGKIKILQDKYKLIKADIMKLVKFFLALIAGLGLVKFLSFVADIDGYEEEEYEVYDEEHDHPLFV